MDVTDARTIGPAYDAAERLLGAPIDILINNARKSCMPKPSSRMPTPTPGDADSVDHPSFLSEDNATSTFWLVNVGPSLPLTCDTPEIW